MADNFELQVSEPIPCEVDYHLSEQQLADYFDLQFQLIQEGKRPPATMELAMLGYALDFLGFAENAANTKIDFQEESLGVFEAILDAIYRMYADEAPSGEDFDDMVKKATGYFGVLILKNIGGNWIQSNIGMGMNIKGSNAFLYNRIARRLTNGREDEVISFYEALKNL
ncbi:MAG: hypothetical protein IJA10_03570 [Lachnospiraceae bacterium]|nr:hypothetical protein [Lachnospiraceae bacterium]